MSMESHSDGSPSSTNTVERAESLAAKKQAACLSCRRSKTRCLRRPEDVHCKRCIQSGIECVIPEFHVGRKKGVKNKRSGLDKAVHRIEEAIKKSRNDVGQPGYEQNALHLQTLLSEAQGLLPQSSPGHTPSQQQRQATPRSSVDPRPAFQHDLLARPLAETNLPQQNGINGNLDVDDAENPLQLLARASDLSVPPSQPLSGHRSSGMLHSRADSTRDYDLKMFFGPFHPSLDLSEDIDPVDMGFVTLEEADVLFTYFYQNLAHTRWGLDSLIHTASFVRTRSAFLFTSIMAASALFLPSAGALSKRLSVHCKALARHVMANRNRSPEIVLAFMVNIPWMSPGKHWSDDETCSYMACAVTIAMDISLDKLILYSPNSFQGIAQSECITARKALDLDGFPDVEPNSPLGLRLLHRRERIWLALFVLDRGVCLARGRSYTVPVTPLIETCDEWHKSEMADVWDSSIVSSAVLRRDLVSLITDVKASCDSDRAQVNQVIGGSIIAQSLQEMIDNFFNRWYETWAFNSGGKQQSIPPYVEILVTHTRLSIYSSVINHPTAPIEVKNFFRAAGLSSSLNVMRAAVQGENRLKSMPNNTTIMVSFAACFAFCLSTMGSGNMSLAPSIRMLIEETADVLERIGATPLHRKGTSALFGRHLREVVRNATSATGMNSRGSGSGQTLMIPGQGQKLEVQTYAAQGHGQAQGQGAMMMAEPPLQFSAMSDDQIIEAINNAGDELEMYGLPNFQIDDRTGLDWLDWFNMDVIS